MAVRPLEGVLVVALEHAVAGPMASCRLADAGARVIKVERPGAGDFSRGYDHAVKGESAYFLWVNRGKESIALDFSRQQDARLLHSIIARADVLLQNLGPGAAARAGFGSADLRARHPRLITCDISGYGPTGPYARARAYDLLVQAESGIASVTGIAQAPGRIGVSACDIATGLAAYAAILEALLVRGRTGEGTALQISMFAAMAEWMAVPLLHYQHQGTVWPRVGLSHPFIAPYGAYPAQDGTLVLLGIQNDQEWARFATTLLQRPQLAEQEAFRTNVARVERRPEVDALVAGWMASLDVDQVIEQLGAAGLACARVNDVGGLAAHPQLELMAVETPVGRVDVPVPPACVAGHGFAAGRVRVPALDEHGAAIRAEFAQQ